MNSTSVSCSSRRQQHDHDTPPPHTYFDCCRVCWLSHIGRVNSFVQDALHDLRTQSRLDWHRIQGACEWRMANLARQAGGGA